MDKKQIEKVMTITDEEIELRKIINWIINLKPDESIIIKKHRDIPPGGNQYYVGFKKSRP